MYRSKKEIAFANICSQVVGNFETNPSDILGTPDLFFREMNVAIFFNGCFWHSHPCRARKVNEEWSCKLSRIKQNDKMVLQRLAHEGIATLTVWECLWEKSVEEQLERIYDYLYLAKNHGMRVRKNGSKSSVSIVA